MEGFTIRFYFVSKECFHNETLRPRIPKTIAKNENNKTPRICVSPSISGCLSATAGRYKPEDELYVHVCETDKFYQPDLNEVPDCIYTGEVWIQHPINMTLHSCIKIEKVYPLLLHDFLSEAISFEIINKKQFTNN